MIVELVAKKLFKIQYSKASPQEHQWSYYAEELRIFLSIHNIDIIFSKTHFTNLNYIKIPNLQF